MIFFCMILLYERNFSYLNFQEEAKLFIVRENFDEALEQALAEKTDFNYAIDKDGNMYEGREYIDYHK